MRLLSHKRSNPETEVYHNPNPVPYSSTLLFFVVNLILWFISCCTTKNSVRIDAAPAVLSFLILMLISSAYGYSYDTVKYASRPEKIP